MAALFNALCVTNMTLPVCLQEAITNKPPQGLVAALVPATRPHDCRRGLPARPPGAASGQGR